MFGRRSRKKRPARVAPLLIGLFLGAVATCLFVFNEGRAVKTARSLREGAGAVVHTDNELIRPEHENALVHVTGVADGETLLRDDEFAIELAGLHLRRRVEMYQWMERKEQRKQDGQKEKVVTYHYEPGWSEQWHDSANFQQAGEHPNPPMPIQSQHYAADVIKLGPFRLPPALSDRLQHQQPLPAEHLVVPDSWQDRLTWDEAEGSRRGFYWARSGTPDEPKIGDVRIRFTWTPPTDVSVVAAQRGDSLEPFQTKSGRRLHMLSVGVRSAEDMIGSAQTQNRALTWGVRIFGLVLMCVGVGLALYPLTTFTDRIPILDGWLGTGVFLLAIVLGIALSLMIVGASWLFYHPLIAIPVLAIGVALLYWVFRKQPAASAAQNTSKPPPLPR